MSRAGKARDRDADLFSQCFHPPWPAPGSSLGRNCSSRLFIRRKKRSWQPTGRQSFFHSFVLGMAGISLGKSYTDLYGSVVPVVKVSYVIIQIHDADSGCQGIDQDERDCYNDPDQRGACVVSPARIGGAERKNQNADEPDDRDGKKQAVSDVSPVFLFPFLIRINYAMMQISVFSCKPALFEAFCEPDPEVF